MIWAVKYLVRLLRLCASALLRLRCLVRGHVFDLPNKRCSRCLEPAPMCEWCGERLATMRTMYVEKPERVCRECVGV